MYIHIEDILVNDSMIARKLDKPVWMNIEGDVVKKEEDAYGCKVEIALERLDMAIVFDEVGCNLSQECDNAKGGQKYLTGVNDQAYFSCATKHSHFTVLGLTTLDGNPLMCVIIMSGKKADISIAEGIDWDQLDQEDGELNLDGDEFDFYNRYKGKGNIFPGGPECTYKGKKIPSLIAMTENGGINGEILLAIFKKLDSLDLYTDDRKNGQIPFVLIDGHQSRFDLDFLKYINEPKTKWNVCIGVPYGTALWQVGDSNQQNGRFKMLLTAKKKEMYQQRLNRFQQNMHLMRTDIVPLVNATWHKAFGDVLGNRKAIAERGWGPFNKNLLLHPLIRSNMTESNMRDEVTRGIFPSRVLRENQNVEYIDNGGHVSIKRISKKRKADESLNFNKGVVAKHVANTIMSECDRQTARERIKKLKTEGTTTRERVLAITKKMTAGKLVLDGGSFILDSSVYEQGERKKKLLWEAEARDRKKKDLEFMKTCYHADKIVARIGTMDVKKWRNMHLIKAYLRSLRVDGDPALPGKREALELRFLQWHDRTRFHLVPDEDTRQNFRRWKRAYEADGGGEKKK